MTSSPKSGKIVDAPDVDVAPAAADAVAVEVAALRAEVQALVEQLGVVRATATSGARRAARAIASEGADAGARVADDLMDEWRALDARVVAETQARPWRSLGIAALIGLMSSQFLRR